MMPTHHPGDDFLVTYAAGSLDEPVGLVVATHLALCPRCRNEVTRLEELGGALLEAEDAEAIDDGSLERVLARLDEAVPEPLRPDPSESERAIDPRVPQPLRSYLGKGLDGLNWKSYRGMDEVDILTEVPGYRTRLMRIKAGAAMPVHTHRGSELTLVLAGGFSDEGGHFLRGDLAEADPSVEHKPIADPDEDCICLAVTDGPLRLTGPIGRLLNPFVKI